MGILRDVVVLDAERPCAERADIVVEGGRIAAVRRARCAEGEILFDGRGRTALLPGLVNAHSHVAMVLLRGLGEERNLMEWLQTQIWPVEARLCAEHVRWGTLQAILEMGACGCTCFADMYFFMEEVAQAALESGMRCGLSRGILWDGKEESWRTRLAEQESLFANWNGREGRIAVQYGPHAPYTLPPEQLHEVVARATERGAGIQIHWLETKWEFDYFATELKRDPIAYLHEAGLFDSPRATLAHGVWFPAERTAEIARPNMTVVHNPSSNLKLGSGVAPVPEMLRSGVRVALGTDGAASNNRLDIWQEMRTCSLLHKGTRHDPTTVPASTVIEMATVAGARALGFDDVGLIRENWQADFALVDLDKPHYVGWTLENLATCLVYAGSCADVIGTMVQGRWIYREGVYPSLDAARILEQSAASRKELTGA